MKKTEKKNTLQRKYSLAHSGLAGEIPGTAPQGATFDLTEDPERIYAFADSLQNTARESEKKIEQVLEPWVIFEVDRESYGFPVSHVQEILRVENITRIPQSPRPVKGITNMRGHLLPVVDLKLRLELNQSEITSWSRILVVNSREKLIGFLVDSVQQVVKLDRLKFEPPPADVMTPRSDYVLAVYHLQDLLVILLDIEKVLLIKDSPEVILTGRPKSGNHK